MKYRSRTEITAQVLEAALSGVARTKIMYTAFLSYAQLKEYLEVLVANGLLGYEKNNQKFRTTEKGRRFLHIYEELDKMYVSSKPEAGKPSRSKASIT